MKTNIKMIAVTMGLAAALCMGGCSKDDSNFTNGGNTSGGNTNEQTENNSLTGTTWIGYKGNSVYTLVFKTSSKGTFNGQATSDNNNYTPQPTTYTYSGDEKSGEGEITRTDKA